MRVSVFACGGGAALLAVSCGGPAFSEGTDRPDAAPLDATARDVVVEVATPDAALDAPVAFEDAAGSDVADVVVADGPPTVDAEPPPPHCGGQFACAPAVPVGWTGPLELYSGPRVSTPCSAHFIGPAYVGSGDLSAPAATCGCQCGAPQGVSCSAPAVSFYDGSMCSATNQPCASANLQPGVCTRVDESMNCLNSIVGIVMTAPGSVASGGSCAPLATSAVPMATWSLNARACLSTAASAQVDCPAGNVCAPIPAAPFGVGVCISHAGDVTCPTVGYPTKEIYYAGVDDTRACSACTCGGVTGATCGATFDVFSSPSMGGCSMGRVTYRAPLSCAAVQQPASFLLTLSASAGSCGASASSPTGSATPVRPTTFCCQ